MSSRDDARNWLRANGLLEVADQIDSLLAKWREKGVSTRRNWWDVLAGTRSGTPCRVEGITFPVLEAARARKGWPTVDAASTITSTPAPAPIAQHRWASKPADDDVAATTAVDAAIHSSDDPDTATTSAPRRQARSRAGLRDKKRGVPATSASELSIAEFAQLERVVVPLRDLVVLVGPQATGKSLVLQMLKLAVDRNRVVRTLKQNGINWSNDTEFAALYFGAGFEKSWLDQTQVVYDSTPISLADVANARAKKGEDAVFYIPAHRTLAIADGWPRSFAQYQIETPFVARRFSEQILAALNLGIVGKGKIFPHDRRLKDAFRRLIDEAVFHGATLKLEVLGMRKQFVLEYGEGAARLPYMAWSAGQREFTPLLLGLYHLLPAGGGPKKKEIQWAIIEEPEMGLHPKATVAVMAVILDLLARGYKVALSTHSPTVLDVVWGMSRLKDNPNGASWLCRMMGLTESPPVLKTARAALAKTYAVVHLQHDEQSGRVVSHDISALDPGAAEPKERGWGGLVGFSARVADIIAESRSPE